MHATVEAQHGHNGSRQANHHRCTSTTPSTTVTELGEDGCGSIPWCKHPQRYHNREQAHDMDYQNQSLDHRQFLGQKGVEKNSKGGNCDDQHGTMPAFKDVSRVVQNDQALYDCPSQERYRHDRALPSCEAQPACVALLACYVCICTQCIPYL